MSIQLNQSNSEIRAQEGTTRKRYNQKLILDNRDILESSNTDVLLEDYNIENNKTKALEEIVKSAIISNKYKLTILLKKNSYKYKDLN